MFLDEMIDGETEQTKGDTDNNNRLEALTSEGQSIAKGTYKQPYWEME